MIKTQTLNLSLIKDDIKNGEHENCIFLFFKICEVEWQKK